MRRENSARRERETNTTTTTRAVVPCVSSSDGAAAEQEWHCLRVTVTRNRNANGGYPGYHPPARRPEKRTASPREGECPARVAARPSHTGVHMCQSEKRNNAAGHSGPVPVAHASTEQLQRSPRAAGRVRTGDGSSRWAAPQPRSGAKLSNHVDSSNFRHFAQPPHAATRQHVAGRGNAQRHCPGGRMMISLHLPRRRTPRE